MTQTVAPPVWACHRAPSLFGSRPVPSDLLTPLTFLSVCPCVPVSVSLFVGLGFLVELGLRVAALVTPPRSYVADRLFDHAAQACYFHCGSHPTWGVVRADGDGLTAAEAFAGWMVDPKESATQLWDTEQPWNYTGGCGQDNTPGWEKR